MVRLAGLVVLGATLVGLGGCSDPTEWDPRAEVRVVQWREVGDTTARGSQVVLSVTNTGKVSLTAVDVAVTVKTDLEDYFVQTEATVALTPGSSAYHHLEVSYRKAEERGTQTGVSVDSVSCR